MWKWNTNRFASIDADVDEGVGPGSNSERQSGWRSAEGMGVADGRAFFFGGPSSLRGGCAIIGSDWDEADAETEGPVVAEVGLLGFGGGGGGATSEIAMGAP